MFEKFNNTENERRRERNGAMIVLGCLSGRSRSFAEPGLSCLPEAPVVCQFSVFGNRDWMFVGCVVVEKKWSLYSTSSVLSQIWEGRK